jgi:hypothetical protein
LSKNSFATEIQFALKKENALREKAKDMPMA